MSSKLLKSRNELTADTLQCGLSKNIAGLALNTANTIDVDTQKIPTLKQSNGKIDLSRLIDNGSTNIRFSTETKEQLNKLYEKVTANHSMDDNSLELIDAILATAFFALYHFRSGAIQVKADVKALINSNHTQSRLDEKTNIDDKIISKSLRPLIKMIYGMVILALGDTSTIGKKSTLIQRFDQLFTNTENDQERFIKRLHLYSPTIAFYAHINQITQTINATADQYLMSNLKDLLSISNEWNHPVFGRERHIANQHHLKNLVYPRSNALKSLSQSIQANKTDQKSNKDLDKAYQAVLDAANLYLTRLSTGLLLNTVNNEPDGIIARTTNEVTSLCNNAETLLARRNDLSSEDIKSQTLFRASAAIHEKIKILNRQQLTVTQHTLDQLANLDSKAHRARPQIEALQNIFKCLEKQGLLVVDHAKHCVSDTMEPENICLYNAYLLSLKRCIENEDRCNEVQTHLRLHWATLSKKYPDLNSTSAQDAARYQAYSALAQLLSALLLTTVALIATSSAMPAAITLCALAIAGGLFANAIYKLSGLKTGQTTPTFDRCNRALLKALNTDGLAPDVQQGNATRRQLLAPSL